METVSSRKCDSPTGQPLCQKRASRICSRCEGESARSNELNAGPARVGVGRLAAVWATGSGSVIAAMARAATTASLYGPAMAGSEVSVG